MDGLLPTALVEALEVLLSLSATGGFTLLGTLAEQAGIQNVLAGHAAIGLWEVWMGAVALFAGLYLFGYRRVYRRHLATPSGAR
jgi:hypothetical protein